MPDPSFSSLYVVPDFPSMLFSYLFPTSLPLAILFPRLYLAVALILLVVPVLGGEFSANSCDSRRLSCLEVTRGLGQNGRNFSCNVGAPQLIGIFVTPPSCESTQLCGFAISSTLLVMVHAMNLLPSPHLPPIHLLPSIIPIIGRMGGRPARDVQHSSFHQHLTHRHILHPYP